MRSPLLLVVPLLASLLCCHGYLVLHDKAYQRLKDASGGFTIAASTRNRLAFDPSTNILYVLAKEPGRLTLFTLGTDGTPTLLAEHTFNIAVMGEPLDITFCRPQMIGHPRVAISFRDPGSLSADGNLRVYHTVSALNTDLREMGTFAVGPEPLDVQFARDCTVMLVANRGIPSRVGNDWRDPEGTISKITVDATFDENNPGSLTTTIGFDALFSGIGSDEYIELLREENFRSVPVRKPAPDNGILTIPQNIEPESIVVDPNQMSAYVTLPKNNAVAKFNLETNQIQTIFPMGNRSWTDYYMDPSDTDNAVNMRGYNIYSIRQPTQMAWVTRSNREWLIVLDQGRMNNPAYNVTDYERARTLLNSGDIDVNDNTLLTQLGQDNELGRLFISKEDGKGMSSGKIENVFAFGGRGFSIHNANTFATVTEAVDNVEQVTKQFYRTVFNSAYFAPGNTPEQDAEETSPTLGPNLGSMAVGDFNGKTVMFFGSETSGIVYLYQLSPDTNCPQPVFHSIHRRGSIYSSWQSAYNSNNMGDIGITDMLYLQDIDLAPIVVVASGTSNSVSVYSVVDGPFNPPVNK